MSDELEKMAHAIQVMQHTIIDVVAKCSAIEFVLLQEGIVTTERLNVIKDMAIEIAKKNVAARNN